MAYESLRPLYLVVYRPIYPSVAVAGNVASALENERSLSSPLIRRLNIERAFAMLRLYDNSSAVH